MRSNFGPMTPTRLIFVAAAAAMLLAAPMRAGDDGDILVDVVVDMTDAGAKVARPSPAHPAYYLPLPVGYKPQGAVVADQKTPPADAQVEHMMAVALAQQGYLVMTRKFMPSLVLTMWWGYMAPEINSTATTVIRGATNNAINRSMLPMFGGGPGAGIGGMDNAMAAALVGQMPTEQMFNQDQMMSLVAGGSDSYQYSFQNSGLIYDQVRTMARSPRHYVMVSAFDFRDWLHHKSTLLWRAHVSTELWGRSLDEVLPTLIATGVPMFGRETNRPRLIHAPLGSGGRVILGTPTVKDYPVGPPAP